MNSTSQRLPQNWAVRFFTIWTGQAFSLFALAILPLFFFSIPQPARHALQASGAIAPTTCFHDLREGFATVAEAD